MKIKELNKIQKNAMSKALIKEHYEWEDKRLISYILGEVPIEKNLYRYSGKELSSEEQEQNEIIEKINEIIKKYNYSMKIEQKEFNELEKEYVKLEKYKEKFYTSYYNVINGMKFNKVIMISGPGGIGKSQFLFEFSEEVSKKFKYLCLYGKYCENIEDEIFSHIVKDIKNDRFYFIIDAINEFDKALRQKIYKFINDNKNNPNLRVIISLRDFSMAEKEIQNLKKFVDIEETFTGVDADNALEKISEKYNLDLSIYDRLLYDNNPLHLKLIIKSISENQLINKRLKPITNGTYIYEHFIKNVLTKNEWYITKDIVEEMLKNKSKEIKVNELNKLHITDINAYINKMKTNNFIATYDYNNDTFVYFINETLTDYLIARFLFDNLEGLSTSEIEEYINKIVKVFYSIHDQVILMLFEKYETNIEMAIKIIKESNLNNYMDIEIFNELNLSTDNMIKIQKLLKVNISLEQLLIRAGGNESNPFNCTNFLNNKLKKLFDKKPLNIVGYDVRKIRCKLKVYVQTISKFNYDKKYIEEKFWYAVWCSSLVNKLTRTLAKKLIFEITNTYPEYINKLISIYDEVKDEYIQEMVIQVLSSLKKNNKIIKKFFYIINIKDFCNIKNLHFISNYLYGKENYEKMEKTNYLLDIDKRIDSNILKFLHRIFFTYKYDYDFFGFETYNSSIRFQTKFMKEARKVVIKVNKFIKNNFKCLNNNDCNSTYFKENFIDKNFSINEEVIEDRVIYLAWQKIFKRYMKKYKIKIKDLDNIHVYEEDEKGIIYKALELSLSKINGSMTCNYFTNDFEIYGDYKGYQFNLYDKYDERAEIYYPVAVFNQDIENLDNKTLKRIVIPEKKNIKWVKNSELSLNNIKKIIEPITYKNEKYYMLYGNVRLDEKSDDEYGNSWIDTYIINFAIDEDYNLCGVSDEDRKYTIDTDKYRGNLEDYKMKNYKMSTSLYSSSDFSDVYAITDFNLPPAIIIKEFDLHYNKFSSSWNDINEEKIILVNNNEGVWYRKGCSGTLYIKEKYYNILIKNHNYKYFCFTEKYHPKTGYCQDSALQVQINSDGSIEKYKHYKSHKHFSGTQNAECKKCIVYKKEKEDEKKWKNNKLYDFLMDDIEKIWDEHDKNAN